MVPVRELEDEMLGEGMGLIYSGFSGFQCFFAIVKWLVNDAKNVAGVFL